MQEYGTILEGIPNEEKTRWLEEQNAYWEIQERALEEQEELVQTGELSQEAYQMQIKIYGKKFQMVLILLNLAKSKCRRAHM